nr:hypothetical protein [Tanacetum cinerariifolium]
MEIQDDLGAELQGRLEEIDEVNVAAKEVNAAEPTVFDDEEVTMTMAQTLLKMKVKKERLLDEQMAKRLHDEEVDQAAAQKQENIDWNIVAEQIQEKHLDNIRKYQSLKRKPISVAQARPIFEREYNKVQTFLKPNRDEEPTKKRGAEETLLQEIFKKLREEVKVLGSHSTQDTPTDDPKEMSEEDVKNMLQIVLVFEFKLEALQVKYPLIYWKIYSEGSRSYWKIIRVGEIIQAYRSFEDMVKDFDREDLDALTMLQVDEDYEMARDLLMKIFMEGKKPKI